jgi:hypothetical protein
MRDLIILKVSFVRQSAVIPSLEPEDGSAIRAGQNHQLRKVEQLNVSAIGATRHAGMCIRDLDQSFCG